MRQLATLTAALLIGSALAQTAAPQAPSAPQAPPAPQATPPRPPMPTRAVDGPGAPKFTRIPTGNAPANTEGNFVIGPEYAAPAELTVMEGVPTGKVTQFTMDSKD